ncbi:MAG TPA: DUF4286 family protein [Candidatus Binataceae bacterium]|nr:DUF4286 family protein [Candidatus Binataceae bacterium]
MAKHTFIVFTNSVEGKESEYNDWYNRQHIPDVLNTPGFVSGQRFRLADTQMSRDGDRTHKYLAVYEIETDDLAGTLKELRARSRTAEIVPSDAIDTKNVATYVFTPVGEKVLASEVRRQRRVA